MYSPREVHPKAVYKILRYSKSTPRKGIFSKKNEELSLEVYIDAHKARLVVN